MKLLTFEGKGGARLGASTADGIVDLTGALAVTHPDVKAAASLLDIIRSRIDIDAIGEQSLERLKKDGALAAHIVQNPIFLPPILRPSKILALALNFREHIEETNLKFYEEPIVFTKYTSNMIGHDGEIELPPFPQKVDEEHELALVVGRECRHIRPHAGARLHLRLHDLQRRVGAQPPARARPDGPALRLRQELRHILPDGPVGRDSARAAGRAQPQDGGARQRQGDAQRQHLEDDLRSVRGAGLLLGLHADAGGRRDLARHLRRRQADQGRRHGRARDRAHRHAQEQRRRGARRAWRNFAEGVTNGPFQKER